MILGCVLFHWISQFDLCFKISVLAGFATAIVWVYIVFSQSLPSNLQNMVTDAVEMIFPPFVSDLEQETTGCYGHRPSQKLT